MTTTIDLAEQHIRESESRLRHVDELMTRARAAASADQATSALAKIQSDRDRLAQELDTLRSLRPGDAPDVLERGAGLTGLLAAVGLQLEQMLATLFSKDDQAR